jgi:hypothetical protein
VDVIARQRVNVVVGDMTVAAARAAWQVAEDVATRQRVYGRSTGVGANYVVAIGERDRAGYGLRLLRSHDAGAGPLLAPEVARALLVIRINQIGAGGSGVDPDLPGGSGQRHQPRLHPARPALRRDRRDAILQVKEDIVGRAAGGLLDEGGAGRGDG